VILRIRAGRLAFGNCEYLGLERRRGIRPISFLYIIGRVLLPLGVWDGTSCDLINSSIETIKKKSNFFFGGGDTQNGAGYHPLTTNGNDGYIMPTLMGQFTWPLLRN
jgi:hypothetical protein